MTPVYFGADHGGFYQKQEILKTLRAQDQDTFDYIDLGPETFEPKDDYIDFAEKVAVTVAEENWNRSLFDWQSFGVLLCRSGNGMCVAANKVPGAYAVLGMSKTHVEMARKDDNANILCLDAEYSEQDQADLVKTFIETTFAGMETRHGRRFKKVVDLERRGLRNEGV